MSTDPRAILKGLLLGVIATLDNDATAAQIVVIYEGGPENLKYLFTVTDYDAVITLRRWDERRAPQPYMVQNWPVRYEKTVPVSVSAIDKTGLTATKLLPKIRDSIRVIIQGVGLSTNSAWFMQENTGDYRYVGGIENLWVDDYRFFYRRAWNN